MGKMLDMPECDEADMYRLSWAIMLSPDTVPKHSTTSANLVVCLTREMVLPLVVTSFTSRVGSSAPYPVVSAVDRFSPDQNRGPRRATTPNCLRNQSVCLQAAIDE